ncbi:MAG TPA: hypothetical protein VH138_11485 [Vicinamibacterales bacterium]|nr:hypothetical protein [Vicinamibacterales bacterium]
MPTRSLRRLNTANFVVLGDGLSGGAGDFGMSEELQPYSFVAQAAARMGATFSQPLMEPPGVGPVIGFPDLPVRVPQPMQTTVLREFPPSRPFQNLSIPGLKLIDALTRRPSSPLIHRSDGLQTAINLILGLPGLALGGNQPLPTQMEYAAFIHPTLALVALGYYDVLDAALRGDASWVPDDVSFRMNYASLLMPFGRMQTTMILCTIPDPADTALFTSVSSAPRLVKAEPAVLTTLFGLRPDECLTPKGLVELSYRLIARTPSPLPDGSVVPSATIARISERVASINRQIRAVAQEHDAVLFDLHGVFDRWKRDGLSAGGTRLTRDYLGGIFSLNGAYPGAVGHGAIANALVETINTTFGTSFSAVDLDELAAFDPVASYRAPEGPDFTKADLASAVPRPANLLAPSAPRTGSAPGAPKGARLTLPPGLVQELPIDPDASYFGEALRAAHARDHKDVMYGSTPNTLFGGACLAQGHLHGTVRITFSEPQEDIAHFTVTLGELEGDDGVFAAPQLFKMPAILNKVTDAPGMISSGDLNLATGDVSNLNVSATFMSTVVLALLSVNPKIPPIACQFPGQYGSAWAKFEQRADGRLDFSFSGVTFMPLGAGFGGDQLRMPLPFAGPSMRFASVPGVGSALHPHLAISTKAPEGEACGGRCPDIPTNTVREYTAFVHNTAFGDVFDLNVPELGGGTTGRAHLSGRFLIQFGERSRGSVPVLISTIVPGGMLATPPESPMAAAFPGRLSLGLLGHDEVLRFPKAAYPMHGVCWVDDPFEFSIGSVDLRTGRFLTPLLYRGFIVQDVLLALMMLEPRTPKSSMFFRGPAAFEKDGSGQTVLSFNGTVKIPYPEGFKFPRPDLQSTFTVGPDSALDPYLYFQAMDGIAPAPDGKSGGARSVLASNGQTFSYSYSIPGYPAGKPASFEYVNETTGGTFRMGSLVWVNFSNAGRDCRPNQCDVITFTGIGLWSQGTQRPHMATVQISTSGEMPYVSIQIDGGVVSNVNTKPAKAVYPLEDLATVSRQV